jgi:hypothetical protein
MGNHLDLPATTTYGEQHTQITGQKGSQLTYRSTLGGSSFLRTFHYVHSHHGLVVVKVSSPHLESSCSSNRSRPWCMLLPVAWACPFLATSSPARPLRAYVYIWREVLQVYTIRETRDREENSRSHPPAILAAQDQLLALNEKLEHIRSPHVCRYRTFEIKSSLAYMLRPYLYSTLHDRVLVRSY